MMVMVMKCFQYKNAKHMIVVVVVVVITRENEWSGFAALREQ